MQSRSSAVQLESNSKSLSELRLTPAYSNHSRKEICGSHTPDPWSPQFDSWSIELRFGELAVLVALLQVIDVVIRSPVVTSRMGVTLVHPAWPLLKRQSTGLRPSNLPPVSTTAVTAPSSRYMHIQHRRRERKARRQHPYSLCSKPHESPIG